MYRNDDKKYKWYSLFFNLGNVPVYSNIKQETCSHIDNTKQVDKCINM